MSVSLNNNVAQVNNIQPSKQPEKKTDEKSKSFPTKTAVILGTGLTALAAVGIYLTTRKKMPTSTINQSKTQDIIDEGVDKFGDKFKTIRDRVTGNWKERITYYSNGKEKAHNWYDGSISNISQSVTKEIGYFENGDIERLSTYKSGKKIKNIRYCSPENKQKYGQNIEIGAKYYPNGNKRFEMAQIPDFQIGTARVYDVDGNLIKERTFLTPKGKATGFKLEE